MTGIWCGYLALSVHCVHIHAPPGRLLSQGQAVNGINCFQSLNCHSPRGTYESIKKSCSIG